MNDKIPLHYQSANHLRKLIADGKIGAEELLRIHLRRVDDINPSLNAIVAINRKDALKQAKNADDIAVKARKRGEQKNLPPLLGLPATVKDAFAVKGLNATAGIKERQDYQPKIDAPAVNKLRKAGAVIFGKTNLPTASADWQSYNPIFGTTSNPHQLSATPGGSSGGAAAAVAAGLTTLELGSDIGGSIRIPAAFCGVCGLKPSNELILTKGHIPPDPENSFGNDLSVAGPIARSADDLKLLFHILAQPDPDEHPAFSFHPPKPRPKPWRIAILHNNQLSKDADVVRNALNLTANLLKQRGCRVRKTQPPVNLKKAHTAYAIMLNAKMANACDPKLRQKIERRAKKRKPQDISPQALADKGFALKHADWINLNQQRLYDALKWKQFFNKWDAVICPTTPVRAFKHDINTPFSKRVIRQDQLITSYRNLLHWAGVATFAKLPAVAVPAPMPEDNLPVGIQVIAPFQNELTAIAVATEIEKAAGGFKPPKMFP